jgi:hypothetical protein
VTWVGTAPRNERYEEALTAIAVAILRADVQVDSVLIGPTTVLLAKRTTVVQFLLSAETRAAIARYVDGAGPFEPGADVLELPHDATAAETEEGLVRIDRAELPPADQDEGAARRGAPNRLARMASRQARLLRIRWRNWWRRPRGGADGPTR